MVDDDVIAADTDDPFEVVLLVRAEPEPSGCGVDDGEHSPAFGGLIKRALAGEDDDVTSGELGALVDDDAVAGPIVRFHRARRHGEGLEPEGVDEEHSDDDDAEDADGRPPPGNAEGATSS